MSDAAADPHQLARTGDTEALRARLREGLDPDLRDANGFPLLMIASYNNHPTTTELLLASGADPNATGPRGNTSLLGLGFKGYVEPARVLIAHGADVNRRGHGEATALMMAAMFGHVELRRMLEEAGADVGAVDAQGKTAAQYAEAHAARRGAA